MRGAGGGGRRDRPDRPISSFRHTLAWALGIDARAGKRPVEKEGKRCGKV